MVQKCEEIVEGDCCCGRRKGQGGFTKFVESMLGEEDGVEGDDDEGGVVVDFGANEFVAEATPSVEVDEELYLEWD